MTGWQCSICSIYTHTLRGRYWGGLYVRESLAIVLGVQVPIAGSGNTQRIVIEFTYLGMNLFKRHR